MEKGICCCAAVENIGQSVKGLADTKAVGSIAQLVERQPNKREVGRSICTGHLALCGTYMISALAFLEFSLSAVHELDVPSQGTGKKKGIRATNFFKNNHYLIMFGMCIPVKGE